MCTIGYPKTNLSPGCVAWMRRSAMTLYVGCRQCIHLANPKLSLTPTEIAPDILTLEVCFSRDYGKFLGSEQCT